MIPMAILIGLILTAVVGGFIALIVTVISQGRRTRKLEATMHTLIDHILMGRTPEQTRTRLRLQD